ncbi:hypothetical protein ACVIG9_002837 [Bradyrhizobium ottawaense]
MPAAFPSSEPTIPTAPLTAEMRDALRAIVGEKGLIEDAHGKQPFVTDWRGLLAWRCRRRRPSWQHRGGLESGPALP